MAIAATSLMRPKIFGPKATGLVRSHCTQAREEKVVTSEVASLELSVALAATPSEDPLVPAGVTSVAGSAKDACSLVASSEASQSSKSVETAGSSSNFSLGHKFPLIPPKLVAKIKFVSMSELLPDNLELSQCGSLEV